MPWEDTEVIDRIFAFVRQPIHQPITVWISIEIIASDGKRSSISGFLPTVARFPHIFFLSSRSCRFKVTLFMIAFTYFHCYYLDLAELK